AGPRTYSDAEFMNTIHNATGLADFSGAAVVVDLMSGPAKVAQGLRERSPRHRYFALDAAEGQLAKVPEGVERLQADVRHMDIGTGFADVVVARYGLKDIPQAQQAGAIAEIYRILKPGGVLVIADMVSPDGMKFRTNEQHSLKQELGGRNIEEEGRCNIPTEDGWFDLLESAGFQVQGRTDYVSHVSTSDWVKGKQITDVHRTRMDGLLASEPPYFKDKFHIRGKSPIKIDFPVLIIRAIKPSPPAERELRTVGSEFVVQFKNG
ncbi:MAG: methyltransferase domain-containing protein, partial [Patescibacteria group bacterium]